jgi:hypothetical protein
MDPDDMDPDPDWDPNIEEGAQDEDTDVVIIDNPTPGSKTGRPLDPIRAYFQPYGEKNKAGRTAARCLTPGCSWKVADGKIEFLRKHAMTCSHMSAERRKEVAGVLGGTSAASVLPLKVMGSRASLCSASGSHSQSQSTLPQHFEIRPVSIAAQKEHDRQQLVFFATSGIPFSAADNHFFLQWMHNIRPSYKPSGA